MVVLDDEGGEIIGWIDSETLFSVAQKITKKDKFGKDHVSYVVEQSNLNKLKDY